MRPTTSCSLSAVFAILSSSAFALLPELHTRQDSTPIATFYFEGPFVSYGYYADFTQCVPEDGKAYEISTEPLTPKILAVPLKLTTSSHTANSTQIYSIIPDDSASNCTFLGADGTLTLIEGYQRDVIPQQYVSVTCNARSGPVVTPPSSDFPQFTHFFPSTDTACVATTGTRSVVTSPISSAVLYPTGTGVPYPTATGYSTGGVVTTTALAYKRDWRQHM